MTPEQERSLLDKIQSDPRQFGALFDLYYKPIFGYIYRRVLDYETSQDIAAETFLKAYLKIGAFHWRGVSVLAWIYKIATNEVNSYFRKNHYSPITFHSILNFESLNLTNGIHSEDEKAKLEEELKRHHDFILIHDKLKLLHIRYQEVIALRYFEGKNIHEIGEILRKPEGTIKSLLSRGLEKLRKLIYK